MLAEEGDSFKRVLRDELGSSFEGLVEHLSHL